jgi:hypothetical protein
MILGADRYTFGLRWKTATGQANYLKLACNLSAGLAGRRIQISKRAGLEGGRIGIRLLTPCDILPTQCVADRFKVVSARHSSPAPNGMRSSFDLFDGERSI